MGTCPTCHRDFEDAAFCPDDGSPLGPAPVRLVDRYRIVRKVGQGGMSEVFLAEHVHIGRQVALKLLRRELASDAQAVERFRREARSTSALGHPNIVHIEDFGQADDGSLYLALEWLDGETLADRLARGPIDPDHALELIEQICAGLEVAHAAGVVHRDMKPANVFLTTGADGRMLAKVLDFGIAKLALADTSLTRTGTFVGTPDYIAPEQALGEEVDGRADVYSTGVMLYELLAGSVPFAGSSFMAVIHQHTLKAPEPPSVRAPHRAIPPALDEIVLRCLEKDPDRRFASVAALAAAIRAVRGSSEATWTVGLAALAQHGAVAIAPARAGGPSAAIARAATEGAATRNERTPPASPRPAPPTPAPAPRVDDPDDDLDPVPARRGRGVAIGLALLAVAGAGVAAYLALRPPAAGPGVAVADAAPHRVALATVDAGPPPTTDVWKFAGQADTFDYTIWISPRVVAPDATFKLDAEIVTDEAARRSWPPGELEVELDLFYFVGHRRVFHTHVDVGRDGHATTDVSLAEAGKYHAHLTLSSGGKPVGVAKFNLCVGADPTRPSAARDRLCPSLDRIE